MSGTSEHPTANGYATHAEVAELRAHLDEAVRTIAEASEAAEEASKVTAKAANLLIETRDEIKRLLDEFRVELGIIRSATDGARADAIDARELAMAAIHDTIPADAPTPKPFRRSDPVPVE